MPRIRLSSAVIILTLLITAAFTTALKVSTFATFTDVTSVKSEVQSLVPRAGNVPREVSPNGKVTNVWSSSILLAEGNSSIFSKSRTTFPLLSRISSGNSEPTLYGLSGYSHVLEGSEKTGIVRTIPITETLAYTIELRNLEKNSGSNSSQYIVTNLAVFTANTAHSFYSDSGTFVATEISTISPMGTETYNLATINALPDGYSGYLIIESDEPITGTVLNSVSGRVMDASNNPISGVIITNGIGDTIATDISGNYTISGLTPGTYMLTPSKSGYTFSPPSRMVSVPPDATGQNFIGGLGVCGVPFFWQRDPQWVNHPLLSNGQCTLNTIGTGGCTLTSAAMVFQYYGATQTSNRTIMNPPDLSDCMGTKACPFDWVTGASCSNRKANWITRYTWDNTTGWNNLDREINQNHRPVIMKLHKSCVVDGKTTTCTHWIVVTAGHGSDPANYAINDPWYEGGQGLKLNSRTATGWLINYLAVYGGQPTCSLASSNSMLGTPVIPQPVKLATVANMTARRSYEANAQSASTADSSVISGTVWVYGATDVTMTVKVSAQSSITDVTEMHIWSDSVTNTEWQTYTTFTWMPVSDFVYAEFRDAAINTSDVYSDTTVPEGPPTAPFPTQSFLPILLKQQ